MNCLFEQPWWLDAVCAGEWHRVQVEKGGEIAAQFVWRERTRLGLRLIDMPPLTQTLGPWIKENSGKRARRISSSAELLQQLIVMLPTFDSFTMNFHHSITNWLPFYWNGFEQTTRYTYILRDLSDLGRIWSGFHESVRRNIRKAEGAHRLQVRELDDIAEFIPVLQMTFARQEKRLPYSEALLRRLDAACAGRRARKMLAAESARGDIHAVLYLVWDERSAYFLMGGANPELRHSGAQSLLLWEAIRASAAMTGAFDFEGSMLQGVERAFRAFGAEQVPYFRVTKRSRRASLLFHGREFSKSLLGRHRRDC